MSARTVEVPDTLLARLQACLLRVVVERKQPSQADVFEAAEGLHAINQLRSKAAAQKEQEPVVEPVKAPLCHKRPSIDDLRTAKAAAHQSRTPLYIEDVLEFLESSEAELFIIDHLNQQRAVVLFEPLLDAMKALMERRQHENERSAAAWRRWSLMEHADRAVSNAQPPEVLGR